MLRRAVAGGQFLGRPVRVRREISMMKRTAGGRRVWVGGAMMLAMAGAGVRAQSPAPRYQSPVFNTPTQAPALPTPAAITPNGAVVEDVVVRVNDQIISRSDVERSQQQLDQENAQQNLAPTEREQRQKDMLRDMIDQQLLLSKAKELGLNADAEVVRRLDEIRKQNHLDAIEERDCPATTPNCTSLEKAARQQNYNFEDFRANIKNQVMTQQVVRDEVGRRLQMTQGQEQAYYQAHKQDFQQPEQVRLSEILIPTPADATESQIAQAQTKADEVAAQVKAGGKFEDLAKKYSGGQTAATGGDLGQFKRGALAKVLEDKTFSLKTGEVTAPIRTKQGFVILKVTNHQDAGIPPLKDVEPQIQETIYMQQMAPALRAYLTRLREEAYMDVKPGFVDAGASPKQTKLVMTAYQAPVVKKKKVVQKARLERGRSKAAPVRGGLAALPAGTGAAAVAPAVSGAAPAPGTTAAIAAAASGAPATQTAQAAAASGKSRAAQRVSARGKQKKVKREKIRYGQAPRNALPAGPEEVASGSDTGAGAQSAAVTPGSVTDQGRSGQAGSEQASGGQGLAPGEAMAPTESTTEISRSSDPDPLAPKVVSTGKVRFSSRDKEYQDRKIAAKQAKVQEKVAATPGGPDVQETATQKVQSAPLGLNGDTAKKQKKLKRQKGEEKQRLQDKKPDTTPAAPISSTVNPNLGATPGGTTPSNAAPDSNDKNTTLPSVTAPPAGAPPQGQPLSPTGAPTTTPNGTAAPQPAGNPQP